MNSWFVLYCLLLTLEIKLSKNKEDLKTKIMNPKYSANHFWAKLWDRCY